MNSNKTQKRFIKTSDHYTLFRYHTIFCSKNNFLPQKQSMADNAVIATVDQTQ